MANSPLQIVDDIALVPLTQTEVANLNLTSLGVVTITSPSGGGDMLKSQFASLDPGAGFVDKALTSLHIPYTGLTNLPGGSVTFLRADGTFAPPPGQIYSITSIASSGLAPALPPSGGFNYYLRGDAQWEPLSSISLSYGQIINAPLAFTPSAHALTHLSGGSDTIPLATSNKSGLVPSLPSSNQTTYFLRGDSSFSQIPNVTASTPGLIPAFPSNTVTFFRGDGTYALPAYGSLSGIPLTFQPVLHALTHVTFGQDLIPNFQIGGVTPGIVPGSTGGTTNFLRADGVWAAPTGLGGLSTSGGAGLLQQLQGTNQTLYYLSGDNSWKLISSLSISYSQLNSVPVFTGSTPGLVPSSTGGTTTFLRADGIFSSPVSSLASSSQQGSVSALPISAGNLYVLNGLNSWQTISSMAFDWSQIATSVPTAFNPIPHASRHLIGGSDQIPLPTTSTSGLVPPLPSSNQSLNFFRGDASFAPIPIASPGISGLVPNPSGLSSQWLRGDATFNTIPLTTTFAAGLAPSIPGNTTTFLRGDGTYASVDFTTGVIGKPTTFNPSPHASSHITGGSDIIPGFSATQNGLVPLSGGGTNNFLRSDGAWVTPSGAGDVAHTRQILTIDSLTGGGDLSSDRTLSFVGDVASPGNWSIYSTNGSGVRGWNPSTSFPVVTVGASGLVPSPPNNSAQFLSGIGSFSTPPTFTAIASGYVTASGGGTSSFLRADGNWVTPPSASNATTSSAGLVPSLQSIGVQPNYYLRGDDTWQLVSGLSIGWSQLTGIPIFSGTATPGLVPASAGSASQFLRGDGQFISPSLASSGSSGYISGLQASNPTAYWARGDNSWQVLPNTTLVLQPWVMPAIGGTVSNVNVLSTSILTTGFSIFTGGPSITNCLMEISSVTDGTHVVLLNRGYSTNPGPGTSIPGGLLFIIGPGIASGTSPGFLPALTGNSAQFLSGAGTWLTPAGGGGSGTVSVQGSISGTGAPGSPLQLSNDSNSPGAFRFYSTDSVGTKGWLPLTYSWETNASFSMPGVGGTQNITFVTNAGMTVGTTIVIEDNSVPPFQGFFEVISVNVDGIHAVLKNQGYALNSAPASVFNSAAAVTLAGPGIATSVYPGFVPAPPAGDTTKFLRGDATFAVPGTFTSVVPGYVPVAPGGNTNFLREDGTWNVPSVGSLAVTGTPGAVAGLSASNQSTSFLRGDNTWQLISSMAFGWSQITSGVPLTFAPAAHSSSHISSGADAIPLFNTSTSVSGLVPGSSGSTTTFLRADGTWATAPSGPSNASAGVAGLVVGLIASPTLQYLRGDNSWQPISGLSIDYGQLTGSVPFAAVTHGSTHLDNGADPIAVVAGVRTGLVPVLPSSAPTTKFLRGDATWTVIPTATATTGGLLPVLPNDITKFFRGDATFTVIPTATSTTGGLLPTPPNFTYQWLRGDASFASIPFTWNITTGFTQPAASGNVSVTFTSTTGLLAGMVISTMDAGNLVNTYSVASITNGTVAVLTNLNMATNTAAASGVNPGPTTMSGPPIVTASAAGIAPVGLGDTTKFLRSDGTWSVPAGSGVSAARLVNTQYSLTGGGDLSADRTLNLVNDTASPGNWMLYSTNVSGTRGWNAVTSLPIATLSNAGLLPTLAGGFSSFLRADGTWAVPASATNAATGAAGLVVGLPSSGLQPYQWLRADNTWQFAPDSNYTSGFTMPAVGSTVSSVVFNSTASWQVGMTLFFATAATATCCFMEIDTISSATQLILRNRGYSSNPVSTTVIPACQVYVSGPGIATSTNSGLLPALTGSTTNYLRADGTWVTISASLAVTGVSGTVAALPATNQTAQWLRSDNSWQFLPFYTITDPSTGAFTIPGAGLPVSITIVSASWLVVGQCVWISDGTHQLFADITTVASGTSIGITNRGYNGNALSGTMSAGATVRLSSPGLATTTQPGFIAPTGSTSTWLRGDGSFQTIPAAAPAAHEATHLDNGSDPIPVVAGARTGLVPVLPSSNPTNQWLRGDATWVASPPLAITTTSTFTWPAVGGTVAVTVDSTALMTVGMAVYLPALGVGEVTVIGSGTSVTLRNNGNTGNAGSTAGVAIGKKIYVGGSGALATATTTGMIPVPPNNQTTFLRGDATFQTPPTATATTVGYVSPPNNTTTFLRGDATWAVPPGTVSGTVATTSSTFTIPAANATVTVAINAATWPIVNQKVYITDASHVMYGNITAVGSSTSITVRNTGDTGNSTSGTMGTSATVSLVGFQIPIFKQWQAALEYSPPATSYATFTVHNARASLSYPASAINGALFFGVVPSGTYLGNGLTVRLKWKSTTATSGVSVWGAAIDPCSTAESSDAWGTQTLNTTTACSGTTSILVESAIPITSANLGGLTAGSPFGLQIQRVGTNGSDTLVGAAYLRFASIETTM